MAVPECSVLGDYSPGIAGGSPRVWRLSGPPVGEFETCPDWAPAMDTGQRAAFGLQLDSRIEV